MYVQKYYTTNNELQKLTVRNLCRSSDEDKVHKDDIIEAGENAPVIFHNDDPVEDLNVYTLERIDKMVTNSYKHYVNAKDLPPTPRAA